MESTCASHLREVKELHEEEAHLLGRESVAPDSEELQEVQRRLVELGPAPRRIPLSERAEMKSRRAARRRVENGDVSGPYPAPCATLNLQGRGVPPRVPR